MGRNPTLVRDCAARAPGPVAAVSKASPVNRHSLSQELTAVAQVVLAVAQRALQAEEDPDFEATDDGAAALELPPLHADSNLGRLAALVLSPAAAQVFRLLIAAEVDRHVQRALRHLSADPTLAGVGVDALLTVAEAVGLAPFPVLAALGPGGALLRFGLVTICNSDHSTLNRRAMVPDRVLQHILGTVEGGPDELPLFLEPARSLDELYVAGRDGSKAALVDELRQILPNLEQRPLWIVGPQGSGRRAVVAAVAAELKLRLICLDHRHIARRKPADLLPLLWREVLLQGALICLHDVQSVEGGVSPRDLYSALVRSGLPAILTSTEIPALEEFEESPRLIELTLPVEAESLRLWRTILPDVAGIENISSRFRLPPGRIRRISEAAVAAATLARQPPDLDDVARAVSHSVGQRVARLGQRVVDFQTWDDAVLPDETLGSLREIVARVRLRHQVLEHWGFQRKLAKGTGLTVLFAGPPGTGKSMAAGLVARELGLELYQIDLSRIASKWIGETEKNLAQVFDAAEGANVMLLFDEADSLFAKRTEVKSANDRYANVEVNYLLQRIERFGGVCVLTTNLEGSIDKAFLRRLSLRIHFPLPDERERAELWWRLLPREAAIAGRLNFSRLAQRYEMSGGHIRNAVLRAAYLAADEGTAITMQHIERAIALEYRDAGRLSTAGQLV